VGPGSMSMGPSFIDSSFCLLRWEHEGALVVAYPSKAMEELTGYTAEECLGKDFSEQFGSVGMASHGVDLAMLADGSSCRPEDITAGILGLSKSIVRLQHMLGSLGAMLSGRSVGLAEQLTFTLDLVRNKSGSVFVCEQVLMVQKHTSLGWPYTCVILRDVTGTISVKTMLRAAARGELPGLVASREAAVHRWLMELSIAPDHAIAFLDKLVVQYLRAFVESQRPRALLSANPACQPEGPQPVAAAAAAGCRQSAVQDAGADLRATAVCHVHDPLAGRGHSRRFPRRGVGGRRARQDSGPT